MHCRKFARVCSAAADREVAGRREKVLPLGIRRMDRWEPLRRGRDSVRPRQSALRQSRSDPSICGTKHNRDRCDVVRDVAAACQSAVGLLPPAVGHLLAAVAVAFRADFRETNLPRLTGEVRVGLDVTDRILPCVMTPARSVPLSETFENHSLEHLLSRRALQGFHLRT